MNSRFILSTLAAAALAVPAGAQMQRRATMVGGGNGDSGRCYAEVVVDGAAQLELRGDTASLRDLSGQQPQWQRLECTGALPPNADLHMTANGRGRAQLVEGARNGGPAIVRIEDPEGGANVYQIELTWNNALANNYNNYNNQGYQYGVNRRYSAAQAMDVCRENIRQQAVNRFGTQNVNITNLRMDDNPGRNDWVLGTVTVRRGWRDEQLPFSCSVNFDNGRVRSASIDSPSGNNGYAARDMAAREMDTCRSAVMDRMGYRVYVGSMDVESRNNVDVLRGAGRANGRGFDFSCFVNPYNGNVRNLDIRQR
jgi:hypothetical protein